MGGKSSSSSNQSATTNNTDRRIVTESGVVATDGASVTVNALDAGIVEKALQTVQVSDVTNAEGFTGLLSLADKFLQESSNLSSRTQDTATKLTERYQADVLDAYSRSTTDKTGSIDQKTMIILGVVGAAALVMPKSRRA